MSAPIEITWKLNGFPHEYWELRANGRETQWTITGMKADKVVVSSGGVRRHVCTSLHEAMTSADRMCRAEIELRGAA